MARRAGAGWLERKRRGGKPNETTQHNTAHLLPFLTRAHGIKLQRVDRGGGRKPYRHGRVIERDDLDDELHLVDGLGLRAWLARRAAVLCIDSRAAGEGKGNKG